MAKWFGGRNKNLDHEKIAAKAKAATRIKELLETGDEDGYVALIKESNPKITPSELVSAIQKFRDYRRAAACGDETPS